MNEEMFEIKGKDGNIQIEKIFSNRSDDIVYKFYYRNNDIDFLSKEVAFDDFDF